MSSHPVRETIGGEVPNTARPEPQHPSPSGGAGNEVTVAFDPSSDAKDHERVRPTVNKVKQILAKIGSASSEDFDKKLEAELAIINKNKKGTIATWHPDTQYIDISDAVCDGICTIVPAGVDSIYLDGL
jgi:hypothetical protein